MSQDQGLTFAFSGKHPMLNYAIFLVLRELVIAATDRCVKM